MPTQKPTTPNGLDLDALQREGETPTPYEFAAFGRRWHCTEPEEIDWQVALDVDTADPRSVLRAYLGDEWTEFSSHTVPGWKLRKLLDAIDEHYNPQTPPGEGDASQPS